MNAIYLHPVDGFTFLENVPEKPIHIDMFTKAGMDKFEAYERALAECIEKRMVIGNPEMVKTVQFHIHHEVGKVYEWPWTYRIDFMNSNDYLAGAQNKVVILCPEPVNSSMSEKEEKKVPSGQSKYSNSEIGSHHWSNTLLSFILRVAEYLETHEDGTGAAERMYYAQWGAEMKVRVIEVADYLQSLPDKGQNDLTQKMINFIRSLRPDEQNELLKKPISEPVVSQEQEEQRELMRQLFQSYADLQYAHDNPNEHFDFFEVLMKKFTITRNP